MVSGKYVCIVYCEKHHLNALNMIPERYAL